MNPAKLTPTQKLQQLKQKHSDRLAHVQALGLKPAQKLRGKLGGGRLISGGIGGSSGSGAMIRGTATTRGGAMTAAPHTFHATTDKLTPSRYRQAFRQLYAFFFLEMSLLVLWMAYRQFTAFPVWFDEGVIKALVFGLPVFWFASRSKFIADEIGLDVDKLFPGLFLGVAIGGLYGFAAEILAITSGTAVVPGQLYLTSSFWWLAFLALLTAWWESLFFFGLPVQFMRSVASWMSSWVQGGSVVIFFLLFHAPLRWLVVGPSPQFMVQMAVLALFAIGQFVVYTRTRNMYTIVLSHLFWGLVIEIYSR